MKKVKERIAVYPYNMEAAPIIRHRDMLDNYTISSLISPTGWGFVGCDAGRADKGEDTGVIVIGGGFDTLDSWETLIVPDVNPNEKFKKTIISNIEYAIENCKNILCGLSLDECTLSNLKNRCQKTGGRFEYLYSLDLQDELIPVVGDHIEEIGVPIILVGGLTENTGKFEIQLTAKKALEEKGYKVSMIGTRNYSKIFGAKPFPNFMLNSGISENNKILKFNRYIKNIEIHENPDVIIIGVPGSMMPFSKTLTNGFGVLTYLISQAVTPDFSIISVMYDDIEPRYFEMLNTSFTYKFGFEIDCFNMSSTQFDAVTSFEEKKLIQNFLDSKMVDDMINKKYSGLSIPVLNVLNSNDNKKMCELLINTLEGYGGREQVVSGGIL